MLIKDLHGNTYKEKGYSLHIAFPLFEDIVELSFNKNVVDNQFIDIIKTKKWTYAIYFNSSMNLWVCYKLEFIKYNELEDIRKSYLHGNKYHS